MDDMRKAFEAWAAANLVGIRPREMYFERDSDKPETYRFAEMKQAWAMWQAATMAEREACAKLCSDADKSTHPADMADAIRSRTE